MKSKKIIENLKRFSNDKTHFENRLNFGVTIQKTQVLLPLIDKWQK